MQCCSSHTATYAGVPLKNCPLALPLKLSSSHHRQHRTALQSQALSVTPAVAAHSLGVPEKDWIASETVDDGQQRRYLTFQEYVDQQFQAQAAAAAAATAAAGASSSSKGQATDADDGTHQEQPKKRVPWNKGRKHTACRHSGNVQLASCWLLI